MLQTIGRSIKIAFVMLKLYRLAYIPTDALNLLSIVAGTGAGIVITEPAENRATLRLTVILYVTVALLVVTISGYYGKHYLRSKVGSDLVYLYHILGPTLIAMVSGTKKRDDVTKWLRYSKVPREEQIERINFAADITKQVSDAVGHGLAQQWFLGANVGPEEISPAEAIRAGRFDEVRISATRIMEDQWS